MQRVERRKRLVTYVTVEREIVTLGPVASAAGKVVRDLRTRHGLTQAEAAQRLGMSRPSLANIEAGRHRILLEDVWPIARLFKASPEGLVKMINSYIE